MSIRKNLLHQFQKIQQELSLPHISFSGLEKLSRETKKNFDDALNHLMAKKGILKRIDVRHEFIKLWKHRGRQISIPISWRYLLSAPFIYGMMIPSVVWMGIIFYFSTQQTAGIISETIPHFIFFKTLHILEYAALAILLFFALKQKIKKNVE